MKNRILFLCLIGLLAFGCQKEELTTYSGDCFVQFERATVDSTVLSFIFFPGQTSIDYPLVLDLIGVAGEHDLHYNVFADPEYTTAIEGEHYSLPEDPVIRAGHYQDTLYLHLNKTPDLENNKVRIILRFEDTDDLRRGKVENSVAIIQFSNTVDRPKWWDSKIEQYTLGTYSDTKYKLFIEVTSVYDMSDDVMNDSERRSYALMFKQYLIDNPTLDEDGQYMTVPVLGLE